MADSEMEAAFTRATGWTKTFNSLEFKMFCLGAEMEREACAVLCETGVDAPHPTVANVVMLNFGPSTALARAIRKRSNV